VHTAHTDLRLRPRGTAAVRAWRSGLTALRRELSACETDASAVVVGASSGTAGERLTAVATKVGQALSEYRRTEQALIRTLKIEISPLKKSR
jgi:hypothetical protein